MWASSNTETAKASPEALWQKWSDVTSWPKQDLSLNSANINGKFEVGSTITLKPKGSPKVSVKLIEVTPLKGFSSTGALLLTKLRFDHIAESTAEGVKFTQSVTMAGPLSGIFSVLMGKKMAENLKARMVNLVNVLETK